MQTYQQLSSHFDQISFISVPYSDMKKEERLIADCLLEINQQEIEYIKELISINEQVHMVSIELQQPAANNQNLRKCIADTLFSMKELLNKLNDISVQQFDEFMRQLINKNKEAIRNFDQNVEIFQKQILTKKGKIDKLQDKKEQIINELKNIETQLELYKNEDKQVQELMNSDLSIKRDHTLVQEPEINNQSAGKFEEELKDSFDPIQEPKKQSSQLIQNLPNSSKSISTIIIYHKKSKKSKSSISSEEINDCNTQFIKRFNEDQQVYLIEEEHSYIVSSWRGLVWKQLDEIPIYCSHSNRVTLIFQVAFTKEQQYQDLLKKLNHIMMQIKTPSIEIYFMIFSQKPEFDVIQYIKSANNSKIENGSFNYYQYCKSLRSTTVFLDLIYSYIIQNQSQLSSEQTPHKYIEQQQQNIKEFQKERQNYENRLKIESINTIKKFEQDNNAILKAQVLSQNKKITEIGLKKAKESKKKVQDLYRQKEELISKQNDIENFERQAQLECKNLEEQVKQLKAKENTSDLSQLQNNQSKFLKFYEKIQEHQHNFKIFLQRQSKIIKICEEIEKKDQKIRQVKELAIELQYLSENK